jgi:hypothetical protein
MKKIFLCAALVLSLSATSAALRTSTVAVKSISTQANTLTSISFTVEKNGEKAEYKMNTGSEAEFFKTMDEVLATYAEEPGRLKITMQATVKLENAEVKNSTKSVKVSDSCDSKAAVETGKKLREQLITAAK